MCAIVHQQHGRNHADKNVGDDQDDSAGATELFAFNQRKARMKTRKGKESKEFDPSAQVIAPARSKQTQQLLQREQYHRHGRQIAGQARHPAFWPQSGLDQPDAGILNKTIAWVRTRSLAIELRLYQAKAAESRAFRLSPPEGRPIRSQDKGRRTLPDSCATAFRSLPCCLRARAW